MKIWKLSLGTNEFNNDKYKEMKKGKLVSVHTKTPAKGQSSTTQGNDFLNAKVGEVFYLCRSNNSVEFIGMFKNNKHRINNDEWALREYVELLESKDKSNYNNKLDKWWTPKNNSTFIRINNDDLQLFENEILLPAFDITIDKLNDLRRSSMIKIYIKEKVNLLKNRKQIILQGPPGTGKTRLAKQMAISMIKSSYPIDTNEEIKNSLEKIGNDRVKLIQFHPSYSYEDFVRGIVADSSSGTIIYKTKDKILAQMAKTAQDDKDKKPYILIIDEINRANLSSVLGELIYALEYRDEAVESMYEIAGSRKITLPSNLYIIGTMNTADRSVGHIDYAIRRRFAFESILPDESAIDLEEGKKLFKKVEKIFDDYISIEFDKNDVKLGHSYFIANDKNELEEKLKYQIKPLLREYLKDGVLRDEAKLEIDELSL